MDIQFFDNGDHTPQPNDKIKIESLSVIPYPDRFRIFIEIKVTPFQERPNLLLVARTVDGKIVGELNIIATMHTNMEFTMHIRGVDDPSGDYTMDAELFYETRKPPQDKASTEFTVPKVEDMQDR
ncbi:MAG: hypothetical protein RLP44_02830 [Aggregatilineales bacterium]